MELLPSLADRRMKPLAPVRHVLTIVDGWSGVTSTLAAIDDAFEAVLGPGRA